MAPPDASCASKDSCFSAGLYGPLIASATCPRSCLPFGSCRGVLGCATRVIVLVCDANRHSRLGANRRSSSAHTLRTLLYARKKWHRIKSSHRGRTCAPTSPSPPGLPGRLTPTGVQALGPTPQQRELLPRSRARWTLGVIFALRVKRVRWNWSLRSEGTLI